MINFASLFNQFRGNSNNPINELLDDPKTPLEKLLDEDSFLNEYKSGNAKVLEYLNYNKVKELLSYITEVGPAEDKKRSYKFKYSQIFRFPLSAADILSSDSNTMADYFLPEGKIYVNEVTYEDVEVEVEVPENKDAENEDADLSTEGSKLEPTEKTIIKDSLETTGEENGAKEKTEAADQTEKAEKTDKADKAENEDQSEEKQEKAEESPAQKAPKTVKVTQKVEKVNKVEVPPLIGDIFDYFDSEITYILTGYVCRVLSALFSKKPNQMMEYLFTGKRIHVLLNHIESRSVGEFLLKVLTLESNKMAKEREDFFKSLLLKLSEDSGVHVLSNFSGFVCETIEKAAASYKSANQIAEFSTIFFAPEIVTIAIKNVISDYENVSVYNAPILLTYLTNVPFTLPDDQKVVDEFKKLLLLFVQKSLQKLNIKNTDRPKLGFGRAKIMEILTYIIRENMLGSRAIFGSQENSFKILFSLCQNYEMNNVLHNEVVKIVTIALSEPSGSELSRALLSNDVLLNFIAQEAAEDQKIRAGVGSQRYRKGFIGHIVQICRLIQEQASKDNENALRIHERDQFQNVLSTLVEKEVFETSKSLAGYSMKKDIKHEIMFQKQDIITHYFDFLSKSPKAVFESEPEPINIEHPDFLEEMERQLEENLAPAESTEVSSTASEDGSAVIEAPVHTFKHHLEYDLVDLMDDLEL